MAPKYKNDLAKCYALLKLNYNWKTTTEEDIPFLNAVSDLTKELTDGSSEDVKPVPVGEDHEGCLKSLSDFLSQYGCPYPALMNGPLEQRFGSADNRMLLLRYLCTELLAKRLLRKKPKQHATSDVHEASQQITTELNRELTDYLNRACNALGLVRPSGEFNLGDTFDAIHKAATLALKRCPPTHFGQPVLPLTGLSDRQWAQAARIAALLQQEYSSRQITLIKRLDVTVQSFKWSDRAKSQLEAISAVYHPIRSEMAKSTFPGVPELLAVRDNMILRIEKTSGARARRFTSCELNKILIGQVPDRGGRAWELEPPPPEMPAFKQRQPDRGRGGGGGGPGSGRGGRGGGGGRGDGGHGFSDRGHGYGAPGGPGMFTHGAPQFRPPAPSAQYGGADYVVTPADYAALSQQMHGLMFEPGMGYGGQPQNYVFQQSTEK
ncbi:hypothetical protein CRM22_002266 [Opisthorchis felineus]|uniref:Protein FAM98A n=1 Tax=Opisthorchis felineus TaxID=147828 RepID=A0A4S2MD95_OPIFE|nr:hypothetical protein CRM22_002266 [Opisthorchis felineus]